MKKRVDNRVCIVYSSYCSDAEQLTYATVAQLVEYDLAKVGVAGSNPVCRSLIKSNAKALLFCFMCVQQSWTTLAGVSPVTVIASEPCS